MSSRCRSSSTSEPMGARRALSLALAAALAAAGCSAFESPESAPQGAAARRAQQPVPAAVGWKPAAPPARIPFDHKFHIGRGLGCTDCHEGTEEADKAPMPSLELCMDCHGEIDEPKPKERTVAAFLDAQGEPQWSRVAAQSPDIVFSHKTHAAKGVACAQCHTGIEEATAVSAALFVTMDACTKCHEEKSAKNECATCHKAAAKSLAEGKGPFFAPANHDPAWRASHGPVSRLGTPRNVAERCDLCHDRPAFPEKANCATCHAETKPASHDAAFRRSHGALVRGDPAAIAEDCAVCHEAERFPDQGRCATCHATTRPEDHDRHWETLHGQSVRRDPHQASGRCAFCHGADGFPLEATCAGCHATDPPKDHTQHWRAGGGHGLAAAIDRGRCEACHTTDSCSACHLTATPRNHGGNWGSPRNRHCVTCHTPLRDETGCGVCHRGAPSHATAPPLPAEPPHRPDDACRKCHFPPRKLRHADNGMICVACHR